MDQLNPYQAPEPLLPTATEVTVKAHSEKVPTEDLVCGLKLLKISVLLTCIRESILVLWHFSHSYRYFIEQPQQNPSDHFAFWVLFLLGVFAEGFFVSGLYCCSIRGVNGVSRVPLLLSLILGVLFFPDELFFDGLQKQWIYFEGLGNAHAVFFLIYLAYSSSFACCIWLVLWMSERHDSRNHKRVLLVLFSNAFGIVFIIFAHMIAVLMLGERPEDFVGYGLYFLFFGIHCFFSLISSLILRKIYSSLIASLNVISTSPSI